MSQHSAFYMDAGLTVYRDGEVFLSPTHIRLLKQVKQDGSILAAAKNLKMSYQHAWHLLDKINHLSPLPIVIRQKGGRDGGGCLISSYGLKLIRVFDKKEADLKDYMDSNCADFDSCFF